MKSISKNIKFVGVDDDNIDLFEGQYPVTNGVSYNSYIIEDEKIAIVDSVDKRRSDEWIAKINIELDGRIPSYLIVQHVEPDHSGSIKALLELYSQLKIVATAKAVSMLGDFFEGIDFVPHSVIVKNGDTLCLGHSTLLFLTAPMVHWPEVMFTLHQDDGVLFSADAFGSFALSSSTEAWDAEARRYYCNIVGKYGTNVQAVMKKLAAKTFGIVAPLHGPVLKDNLGHYWNLYDKWSRCEPESNGILIAYASVYGGTAKAARHLATVLENCCDDEIVLIDLCRHDVSYAVAEAFRLKKLVLCSITYDAALFPAMYNFIHHLDIKNFHGRCVGLIENGSWAPVAARQMAGMLSNMKDMTVVEPVITIYNCLHKDNYIAIDALARNLTVH